MSNALQYALNAEKLLDGKLLAYYNFATGEYNTAGLIPNNAPAYNTTLYTGVALSATTDVELFENFLIPDGSGNFGYSTMEISGGLNTDFKNLSILIEFEQFGTDSSILFGSLDRYTQDGISAASGYNWGINSYGRMFFQHVTDNGDYIYDSNIDLSQKNVVSFAINGNSIDISRHDYNRDLTETNSFLINEDSIANPQQAFFGGSNTFYRSSDASQPTFSGWIGNILIFSGYLSANKLFNVGKAFCSSYSEQAETTETVSVISGYERVPVYASGYTGYIVNYSAVNKPISGQYKVFDGSFGSSTINEGETYLTGSLLGGDYVIEKKAVLINDDPFNYAPTGDEPIDTLGLRDVSTSRNVFTASVSYFNSLETGLLNYSVVGVSGLTKQATGYIDSPLYQDITVTTPGSSGISFVDGCIDKYNYNYFYYEGVRV